MVGIEVALPNADLKFEDVYIIGFINRTKESVIIWKYTKLAKIWKSLNERKGFFL